MGSLRRLLLGVFLLAGASAILLLSDLRSRVGAPPANATTGASRVKRVAILQHASQAALDQGREGMLAGLRQRGWTPDGNLEIRYFNAEGDNAVAQAIARTMAGGGYDLLLTISTVSMQAVANANRAVGTPHVFALVSDPAGAGVGIRHEDPLDHPPHLAGFGTMQPVEQALATARAMNPALASVGVVWNAAEANSEAQVRLARAASARMGLALVEATVDNTAGVAEAAGALVSRGVDCLWVGGDVMVMTAIDGLIAAARKGGIPVFTVIPPNVRRGTLFDLGADYAEVGRLAGELAAEVLAGRSPATVPIRNVLPETLMLNQQAAAGLRVAWKFPPDLLGRARLVIDAQGGEHPRPAPATASGTVPPPSRLARVEGGRD